jgi:hypothetical protein
LKCFIFSHMNIKWKWKYRVFLEIEILFNLMRFCASLRTCWIKYWKWGNFKSIEWKQNFTICIENLNAFISVEFTRFEFWILFLF